MSDNNFATFSVGIAGTGGSTGSEGVGSTGVGSGGSGVTGVYMPEDGLSVFLHPVMAKHVAIIIITHKKR